MYLGLGVAQVLLQVCPDCKLPLRLERPGAKNCVCPLKKESGFTLIELLIVVSIVMILAVLASAFIRGDKGFPGTATHQPYHDSYYHN